MKKFFATLVLLNLFSSPASALPGWTSVQIREWIKNHKFLAPNYEESGAGVTWYIRAHRDLDGGKQVEVRYENGYARDPRNVTYQILRLSAVLTNPTEVQDREISGIWFRESEKALTILEQVYSKGIADDFKQSKFVFEDLDYYCEENSYSFRRSKIDDVPTQTGDMWDNGNIQFFKGSLYAYEVNAKKSQLTIFAIKDLGEEIAIMQHNKKIYDAYKQREDRKYPAKLNL